MKKKRIKKKHKVISDTESDSDLISGSDTYSDESDSESVSASSTSSSAVVMVVLAISGGFTEPPSNTLSGNWLLPHMFKSNDAAISNGSRSDRNLVNRSG